MIHTCSYCKNSFTAHRKDKKYCSNSCKQMAFMKRQFAADAILENRQNVNKAEQKIIKTSNIPNSISPMLNDSAYKPIETETITPKPLDTIYKPIECKWINEIYASVRERENDEKLNYMLASEKATSVKWVSIRYYCLLDCLIKISEMNNVPWSDMAELTNAFTSIIASAQFKELPWDYPFTKNIVSLRNKLRSFCLTTQEDEDVEFRLKFETKKMLFLQRFELSMIFPKIPFDQLQHHDHS